ncbi:hypothetical protein ACO0QE_002959 [Hanseniaspora vineae]
MGVDSIKDTLKIPVSVTDANSESGIESVSSNNSFISTEDARNETRSLINDHGHQSRHTDSFNGNQFKLTVDQLSELHDPKSLHAFNNVFDNDYNNLFEYLKTDAKNGISVAKNENSDDDDDDDDEGNNTNSNLSELEKQRQKVYGINKLPEKQSKTLWQLLWEGLQDRTMIILSAAAIVSLALGLYETFGQPPEYDNEGKVIPKVDWVEGVAILIAILVVISVGAANDYQKEQQFKKLNSKKQDRSITVIRNNGETHVVSIYEVMVGDIISLQTGEVVPADCILVSGECECDESALTGESDTIEKYPLKKCLDHFNNDINDQSLDITNMGTEKILDPMLISGSKLLSGLGTAVVTAVGVNSVHGKTMQALKVDSEVTPLQKRLGKLADNISLFGCLASLVLFIVLFIRFCINISPHHIYHNLPSSEKGSKFMNIFIVSIALIAVAIPEGLPLAVTLALAFSTTRMSKDGNLVRVLSSCETMGSATCICSDKTGTLTENRMTVVKGFINGKEFDDNHDNAVDYSDDEDDEQERATTAVNSQRKKKIQTSISIKKTWSKDLINDLLANIVLNSTAFENKDKDNENSSTGNQSENPFDHHLKHKKKHKTRTSSEVVENMVNLNPEPYLGSKTETALLKFADKTLDKKLLQTYRSTPEETELDVQEVVETIPFESSRKWSGIVVKLKSQRDIYRLYVKGASEIVLSKCGFVVVNEDISHIDDSQYKNMSEKILYLANQALRTISLAHKDYDLSEISDCSSWPPKFLQSPENPSKCDPDLLLDPNFDRTNSDNSGMVLDAIVGVQDPLREGVKNSVEQCRRAGVTVRMVTGDNLNTARAIALNASILTEEQYNDENCAMEGPVFRKLSQEQKIEIIPKLRVLARSSPEDKRVLVDNLRKMNEIVAVTGDGTNDAPALKLADVGFSMGIAGTEVAREASDIILMTDNFSAIVSAIKWGRCVAISIKKFVQFQLTVNFTAVILTFVSAVASKSETSVLTAVQLLWVNLIMDTLAALALATDKPDDAILDRHPKGRNAPLISPAMWKMILIQSGVQIIITFVLHFRGEDFFFNGQATAHQQQQISSLTFNAFVWLQFFNLIVTRKFDEADGIETVKGRFTLSNLNFFSHFFSNYYFIAILLIIGGFQVLIMYVGGAAFSIARQTPGMWATAILCGLGSLLVGVIVRLIPDRWVTKYFPTRLAHKLEYYLFLGFLQKNKEPGFDLENSSGSDGQPEK